MRQIVLRAVGDMQIDEVPHPTSPLSHEVQARVRRVGICGTDLHAFAGKQPFFSYPRILGHELAVEVIACGDAVSNVAVGDIVAVRPYLECGTCRACQRGLTNCCESLRVLGVHIDGGMREYINLPASHLHHATGVDVDGLAMVEMLSIGFHAVRRAHPATDDRIVIIGLGPIGLGVALAARARGLTTVAIDPSPGRREFALTHQLVAAAHAPGDNVQTTARELCGGHAPDIVLDATGHVGAMESSVMIPGHGGKVIFVGLVQGNISVSDPDLHRREITIMASRNATSVDFDAVIAALPSISVPAWVTHHTTPALLADCMPAWRDPATGVIKGMLSFD
ncbi:MAG: zinc-binding alcohol dehydrogenase family protein [Roseiflexaceae bacterium]